MFLDRIEGDRIFADTSDEYRAYMEVFWPVLLHLVVGIRYTCYRYRFQFQRGFDLFERYLQRG